MTGVLAQSTGESYVVAAYLVFLALLLIYVAIMASRIMRVERELSELGQLAAKRDVPREPAGDEVPA